MCAWLFEVDEDLQLVLHDPCGIGNGIFRCDDAIGFDVQRQLVVVGHLTHTGVFDVIRHLAHGGENAVHRNKSNRRIFRAVQRRRAVTLACVDGHFHVQLRALVERADNQIRVHDFDIGTGFDHAGGDFARAFGVQTHTLRTFDVHTHGQCLDVQDNVGDILTNALNGGELVQNTVNLNRRHRSTLQRGQENPAQCVPQCQAKTTLQRLSDDLAIGAAVSAMFDVDLGRFNQFLPVLLNHDASLFLPN